MLDYDEITELKKRYQSGGNISEYLRGQTRLDKQAVIQYSYDLQAGSYVEQLQREELFQLKQRVGKKFADLFSSLAVTRVCEAGIGEATTLAFVAEQVSPTVKLSGFDLSASRLLCAKQFLQKKVAQQVELFAADMLHIPHRSDSIQCVYTNHAIEPNGGREALILKELLRISSEYLVLVEPCYEMFSDEQRQRMTQHGYCRNLKDTLCSLGNVEIVRYEPWQLDSNPLNCAALIVARKRRSATPQESDYVSPISYQPLRRVPEGWFCQADGHLFFNLNDIPIFLRDQALLVSRYDDFIGGFSHVG